MSNLKVYHEDKPATVLVNTNDGAEMARHLKEIGVRFERWQAAQPVAAGAAQDVVLTAYRAMAPLQNGPEISFILDKNKVETTRERMRVQTARYRGQDNQGRPFTLDAASAVQVSTNGTNQPCSSSIVARTFTSSSMPLGRVNSQLLQ